MATKEGGRKRNAVCEDYGGHRIRYILSTQLVSSLSDLSWLGNHRLVSFGWVTTEQTRTSHQIDKGLVFLYNLGVQNLKQSEATFTLFFPLSLLVRLFHVLPKVMLLPCIRAPLNGQFDLLGDERGPRVARGAYLRAWPFVSLHTISLEARWGPASLSST